ncbi:MAG: hypothetical protein M3273_04565 [Actinomycetota bacterium]|nr:hypothetical protein [Actinomycetota bacterium]
MGRTKWIVSVVAGLAVVAVTAPAAYAKIDLQIEEATVTGPGLDEPLVLKGGGPLSRAGAATLLSDATRLSDALMHALEPSMFGSGLYDEAPDPGADLGPRYVVTWRARIGTHSRPGGFRYERVVYVQHVYPYAPDEARIYTPAGQRLLGKTNPEGGWFSGPSVMVENLQGYGLPTERELAPASAKAPATKSSSWMPLSALLAAVAVAILGAASISYRNGRVSAGE